MMMSWAGCKSIALGGILKIQVMKRRGALRIFFRSPDNTFIQTIKFCLVGLLNTALTAAVIFAFIHIGTGIYLSNFIGYAVGIAFSFVINTIFTFLTSLSFHRLGKFLLTCLTSYLVNIGVI
ncbi:MAG: GtrA family protein [Sodalis sp. (in: enterobacteria)]|uniref:GtrA family protein n=1 Tax=Sodalis sp. (in: enterobacteria) TaxID=1898979 RepID=UPI003F31B697